MISSREDNIDRVEVRRKCRRKQPVEREKERNQGRGGGEKGQIEMVDTIDDNNNWIIYSKGTEKEAW